MKTSRISLAALLALSALPSLAQTAAPAPAPAPTPDYTLTGNLGIFSDYRFRGISQTNKRPAIQGGIDFAHSSGLYLGNWNSNVDSAMYSGANIEMDFYGGWKTTWEGFGFDVGAIYYYYPGSGDQNAYGPGAFKTNNTELYVGGSWGPVSFKYNYAVSDFFGVPDSSGAYYLLLSGVYDFGNGFGVNASVGYQGGLKNGACVTEIDGQLSCSITDWKIGGTYTFDGWALGLAYVSTNRDLSFGTASASGRNISSGTAVVSVSKSF